MSDVTRILSALEQGDPRAAEQLLPLVYEELRRLAAARLAHEKPGQTLQATALVHEAYLRLVGPPQVRQQASGDSPPSRGGEEATPDPGPAFNSRGHFFAAAAEAMRRILVEQARRRAAAKRGGAAVRQPLHESAVAGPDREQELLAIDDVLDRLAQADPLAATLVKLRFFVGLNMSETAEALGISVRSAHDVWAYARAWLHQRLRPE